MKCKSVLRYLIMITLDQEGGKKVILMTENEDITKLTQLCD